MTVTAWPEAAQWAELYDLHESFIAACKGKLDWQEHYGCPWSFEDLRETLDFLNDCMEHMDTLRAILYR